MSQRALWIALALVVGVSFAVLLLCGADIYSQAPPVPAKVIDTAGQLVLVGDDIRTGQNVWQSIGGQELGSIWGHGAYVAPDWTADWLHREATSLLDAWAAEAGGASFASLGLEQQAALRARLAAELRRNTYDAASGALTISPPRAQVVRGLTAYYSGLFGHDPQYDGLRRAYAMRPDTIADAGQQRQFGAFLFWAAWACSTDRPGQAVTYTSNWPPEDLVANRPTGSIILWTGFSVMMLIAGIGLLSWFRVTQRQEPGPATLPEQDALGALQLTPSMRAHLPLLRDRGAPAARAGRRRSHHRALRGRGHRLLRHPAAALAALLGHPHLAPAARPVLDRYGLAGHRPVPRARCSAARSPGASASACNVLFVCLVIIVAGSLAGEWLSVQHQLG